MSSLKRPGAQETPATVFSRSYSRVEQLIEELGQLASDKDKFRKVAGTNLVLGLSCERPRSKGSDSITTLYAKHGDNLHGLVSMTRHLLPRQGAPVPQAVGAFRGEEIPADYSFSSHPSGVVTCHLGHLGVNGRRPPGERPGSCNMGANIALETLADVDRQHIEVVESAIGRSVDVAETVFLGSSVPEAFEAIGRPV